MSSYHHRSAPYGPQRGNNDDSRRVHVNSSSVRDRYTATDRLRYQDAQRDYGRLVTRDEIRGMTVHQRHQAMMSIALSSRNRQQSTAQSESSHHRRPLSDYAALRSKHRFVRDPDDDADESWANQLAKEYYDRLYHEYVICDLKGYRKNQIGFRWQTEQEMLQGKGQMRCANMRCTSTQQLRTFEVDFAYKEHGEHRRELVKVRLCYPCSIKLNWRSIKKAKRKGKEFRIKKDESVVDAGETTADRGDVVDLSNEDGRIKEELVDGNESADDIDENDKEALKVCWVVLEERMWRNDGQGAVATGEEKRANEFGDYFDELFQ
ncbi:hypothetical protein FOL47_004889 [Perkinsus chesapeaki]|uniref:Protein FRA10AC1 n=1 Tax=Perkinsus chesapeaki TaxID=330153 RepID=A0A7J6M0E3_PERCH|nr:hypothetical protein FOL47_004889 [Perkinsus chesapeaki]